MSVRAMHLRPTLASDLDYVVQVEQDVDNRPYITPWARTQHEGAIRFPDFRHFIVEEAHDAGPVGFVILQGCRSPHRCVELKRMVLQRKGLGLGRSTLRAITRLVFQDLGAHRLWLDVRSRNGRALALYRSEGFVQEGILRESVRDGEGRDSLVVMSMLQKEYFAQRP